MPEANGSGAGCETAGTLLASLSLSRVVVQRRSLTLIHCVSVIVGIVIGSGIFASPGRVLRESGSVGGSFLVWVAAGVYSLVGALCYAELGTRDPANGGDYLYIREGYGECTAFVFSWTQLTVLRPGSQAIASIIFARYLAEAFLPNFNADGSSSDGDLRVKALAIVLLVILSVANGQGTRFAGNIQVAATFVKVACLVFLVVGALIHIAVGGSTHGTFSAGFQPVASTDASQVGHALIAALWAFDGWAYLNNALGAVVRPERNLPLAILLGVTFVTAAYVLVNIAYLVLLGPAAVVDSSAVATDAARALIGESAAKVIPVLVAISALGTVNGSILTGSRLYQATAEKGYFPAALARTARGGAPRVAIGVGCVWAIGLVLVGDFSRLVDYFGFGANIFYGLAALCVVKFRKMDRRGSREARPLFSGDEDGGIEMGAEDGSSGECAREEHTSNEEAHRSQSGDRHIFRAPLVPFSPMLFAMGAVLVAGNTFAQVPWQSAIASLFILSGIPLFYVMRRRRRGR